jgi:hypothetical protein
MAKLNFPDNPLDGQLFPNPCPEGVTQYRWDVSTGIWRIVGVATGVNPGQYGDELNVGQFTVDASGKLTQANNVPIARASVFSLGVVQLSNQLDSISDSRALTASAGRNLQLQIGNLNNCIVPSHNNVVDALNSLQQQTTNLNEGALIWCGYYNAQEGDISFVSLAGQRLGYQIGQELPVASSENGGDFFIVTKAGNPYIAGDYNAPDEYIPSGDWIVSEKFRWSVANASGGDILASDVIYNPTPPVTSTDVQGAIYQVTQLLRTGVGGATVSSTKPLNPYPGQLWWDSDDGIFYIYYVDSNSQQWVEAGGGNSANLQAGNGVYLINTGTGLSGGPITTEGTINLEPAFIDKFDPDESIIGGVIPGVGFDYSNTTGELNVRLTGDFTGKDPETAFSQEGANILNSKIDSLSGANVLAGTYDASVGELVFATPAGLAKGFAPGQNLPAPSLLIDNYYVIVTRGGGVGPEGAAESEAGDWWICEGEADPPVWFLIDYDTPGQTASSVAVIPIPGIEQGTNVQSALALVELQAQDRVEFVESTTDGLQIEVSTPVTTDYDGTTLSIGLDYASTSQRGIVQLTNDFTGDSETIAITQQAANVLNAKVDSLAGANVLAGTYNSNQGIVSSVTPAGEAAGLVVNQQAPSADSVPDNYYLIVTVSGGYGPPGATLPETGVQSGDWFICERAQGSGKWITIDYENRAVTATMVAISPIPGISATQVQGALAQLQTSVSETFTEMAVGNDGLKLDVTPVNGDIGFRATFSLNPATSLDIGGVFVGGDVGLNLSPSGGLSLAPATATVIGGVKIGSGINLSPDGTISVDDAPEVLPPTQIDNIVFDGVSTSFPLRSGGVAITPTNAVSVMIVVGGVIQTAAVSYSIVGTNIQFTEAPATGTTFYGVAYSYTKG